MHMFLCHYFFTCKHERERTESALVYAKHSKKSCVEHISD